MKLDQNYWTERYQNYETGWDLGEVSPPLKAFIDQLDDRHAPILIPGAGNGYEVLYLLENGFTDVTVVDIAQPPLRTLRVKEPDTSRLKLVHGNFFDLDSLSSFKYVLEQTFFCALDPSLRTDYVTQMHKILQQGGVVAGVLFDRQFPLQGPPFGGSSEEYQHLFKAHFDYFKISPCYNSIPPRQGSEVFFIAQK